MGQPPQVSKLALKRRLSVQHRSTRDCSGFSLLGCLIATALTLLMLGGLSAASIELVSTMTLAAERLDQSIRLRQINRYLDSVLLQAQMPRQWRQSNATVSAPVQWRAPTDPCQLPESLGAVRQWGGMDIIRLDEAPCLPGSAQGLGLYIETIYPCPDTCEHVAGYALVPQDCAVEFTSDGSYAARWRVRWQQSLESLEGCPSGTPWARLERLIVSHRSTGALGGSDQLRLQRLADHNGTRWTRGEVVVGDVVSWRLTMLDLSPASGVSHFAHDLQADAASVSPATFEFPQLMFSVAASTTPSQSRLSASRLLVPGQ